MEDQLSRLREYLKNFNEYQVNTLAEMVAMDCVLMEIWQENVTNVIIKGEWDSNLLLRFLIDRLEEVIRSVEQGTDITDNGNFW